MGFITSIETCFSKYGTFEGRASRSEYWWFGVFYSLTMVITVWVSATTLWLEAALSCYCALSLILFLPSISVMVRRLHDTNHSGWNYWWAIVPFGGLYLFYLMCEPSDMGANDYGLLDEYKKDHNVNQSPELYTPRNARYVQIVPNHCIQTIHVPSNDGYGDYTIVVEPGVQTGANPFWAILFGGIAIILLCVCIIICKEQQDINFPQYSKVWGIGVENTKAEDVNITEDVYTTAYVPQKTNKELVIELLESTRIAYENANSMEELNQAEADAKEKERKIRQTCTVSELEEITHNIEYNEAWKRCLKAYEKAYEKLNEPVYCPDCDGEGEIECWQCHGKGWYVVDDNYMCCEECGGIPISQTSDVAHLLIQDGDDPNGTGYIECPTCNGSGKNYDYD